MKIAAVTAVLLAFATAGTALAQGPAKPAPTAAQPPGRSKVERKPSLADLAAKGDAGAQYQLGLAAEAAKGKNATKVRAHALGWFVLAGGNGDVRGALRAAQIYEQRGDVANMARWLYRAGELGDAAARDRFLGLFLAGKIKGIGGPAGSSWLATRAATGDGAAQIALGDLYERGRGVPVDLSRAQLWFLEAALDGNIEGMFRLGRLQIALPAVWRTPTKETGKDGKWQGPATYPLRPGARDKDTKEPDLGRSAVAAAADVDPDAVLFFRPGMVEGEHWLTMAARRGYVDAQYVLGKAYVTGKDLPIDMPVGVSWLQAAARNDHVAALKLLGDLAASGQGFAGKDPVRAWANYDVAARLGDRTAADDRDRVARAMNARQIARARQIAQEWPSQRGM
ncbi:MAG: tetratricopeptide repeat protein [Magnetospirillum sp.]|nr:tetratricopeptide repeat protein [Magnetospirillum sp.]